VESNPFELLDWPAYHRPPPDPYTVEERDRILAWVAEHESFYYPWVYFHFATGCRPSESDPSGELEVCVGNVDIHFVERQPSYYDGCIQVLKRDESLSGYNIVGAELRSKGDKLSIHTYSIEDMFLDNHDAPVTYDDPVTEQRYVEPVQKWRDEARRITKEVSEWADKQFPKSATKCARFIGGPSGNRTR